MGYTHYMKQKRSFSKDEWNKLKDLTQEIIDYCDVPLDTDEYPLEINDEVIRFNGVGDDSHETFYLTPVPELQPWQDEHFNFCKTARKPYDVPVAMVLLAINHFIPGVMEISSNGGWDEDTRQLDYDGGWVHIREMFADFFDEEPECPWSE